MYRLYVDSLIAHGWAEVVAEGRLLPKGHSGALASVAVAAKVQISEVEDIVRLVRPITMKTVNLCSSR